MAKELKKCKVKICTELAAYSNLLCSAHNRRLATKGHVFPNKPIRKRIFGKTIINEPEYRAWKNLRHRCNTPTSKGYEHYGGRGIKVCKRWNSYENFLKDMGKRPGENYSIERINNNKNYSPANCKWATITEQIRNRRTTITKKKAQEILELKSMGITHKLISSLTGVHPGLISLISRGIHWTQNA